ncbi:PhzF family phenazine biosynthesis protein [Streptomyces diastatochromogenes]|nr:PhzF family phenazine biosynthesis protein [Streptomyces diastatochromogenes]
MRRGLVTVRRGEDTLSFAAPPRVRDGALDDDYLNRIVAAFGITRDRVVAHQWVDNGPGWAVVQLATAEEVLALEPDLALIPTSMVGAIGAHPEGSEYDFEMRTFAPGAGVPRTRVRQHERRRRAVAHRHRRRTLGLPGLPGHEAGTGGEHRDRRRCGRHRLGQRRRRHLRPRHHHSLTARHAVGSAESVFMVT